MARKLRQRLVRWLLAAFPAAAEEPPSQPPLLDVYSEMVALLRDQIAEQLESASTNDLVAAAALAAVIALLVALLLIKEASQNSTIGYWWWYGFPLFVIPMLLVSQVLRRPSRTRQFEDGPKVPPFLRGLRRSPVSVQGAYERLMRDLFSAWTNNDRLLYRESRCLYTWGLPTLLVASLINIGLYTWALN